MCNCCSAKCCPGCCPDPRTKLDLTKPLQLSNGSPARLLASDLRGNYPIAVAVAGTVRDHIWRSTLDGKCEGLNTALRLVNALPKPVTIQRWFIVWKDAWGKWRTDQYDHEPHEGYGKVVGPVEITFTPKE